MDDENCTITTHQTMNPHSLTEALRRFMAPPPEEELYQAAIKLQFWSIDQFAALMGGLTPENYKNGTKGSAEISDDMFTKREAFATKIFSRFLDDMEKTSMRRDFFISDENMLMSAWKFIKWAALNNIDPKQRFFNSLPLILKELYFEFQPISVALRTQSQ